LSPLLLRKIHRYAGVFFAPALLFFCATGVLQTFDLHRARPGAQPARLVLELAALHKNQTLETPRRPTVQPAARTGGDKTGRGQAPRRDASLGERLMKLFVTAAAVTLAATTLAGVYMSLRPARGRRLGWALLALGVAPPVGLMLLM
jgi:hypothetical protein